MDVHEIGSRIKQARTLRNYTLDDIANEICVAKSTIQRYENGLIGKPKLPVLQAIADSLGVNPVWISGQDVPMIVDESLNNIINIRLKELDISLEDVAEKSSVSLYWLQHIDSFIPGQFGDIDIGYDWITRVAEVIGLPSGKLRAALAKQEIPTFDGPMITASEAFSQEQKDYEKTCRTDNIIVSLSKTEREHLHRYRHLDEKGKHTVNTILEMEYNRYKSEANNLVDIKKIISMHTEPQAAHERTDIEVSEEMRKHDDDIMDDDNFWNK